MRGFWRWLTSMRTALILLFLLAVAAVPGSLLPQRRVNPEKVTAYLQDHSRLGPWLDRFGFFDVFSSPWFSAIYLLLFLSLVGCLVPRLRQHIAALRAVPPAAPSRLDRLPQHADGMEHDGPPAEVAAAIRTRLRRGRWRVVVRDEPDGSVTVAAEKGYLKETGNLLFHFALLALLIGVAWGSWYGWHANRLLVQGGEGFCSTPQQFDDYSPGARVGAGDLPRFCVRLDGFGAEYLDNGQPVQYRADLSYQDPVDGPTRTSTVEVNEPLRLPGANVHLLGHGYAPILRYTDRYGVAQTAVVPFLPTDEMLTSDGVATFPDANVDPTGKTPRDRTAQVAFAGIYLPTRPDSVVSGRSAFPAERSPALMLNAYVGNLGLDSGVPQSVYTLDQRQIDNGQLKMVGDPAGHRLRPGESWTLPDGSTVEFLGTRPWVTLSIRYDPGERVVLVGAGALLVGLVISLTGRRRRIWARISPEGEGRSLVSMGGLARTEYPGFAEEFARLVAEQNRSVPQPVAVGEDR